jgi:hypothetical protein
MKDQRTGRIGMSGRHVVVKMIHDGKTANEIADCLNVNPETVRKFARKRGMKIARQDMSMENHPSWRDGTVVASNGYILRRVPKDGLYGYLIRAIQKRGKAGADPCGYAPIHRIVMHDKLGRPLVKGEVVDHIDGDVKNNAPENLRVFESNSAHLKATLKGKVPKWTEQGMANMRAPRPNYRRAKSQP